MEGLYLESAHVTHLPDVRTSMAEAPILHVDYRGNVTQLAFFENVIHESDVDGNYRYFQLQTYGKIIAVLTPRRGPNVRYLSMGKHIIMNNALLPRPSPCGANCSYGLSFFGPNLHCADGAPPQLERGVTLQFFAIKNYNMTNITSRTREEGGLAWTDDGGHRYGGLRNLSCIAQDTSYTAHVNYLNTVQSVDLEIIEEMTLRERLGEVKSGSAVYDVLRQKSNITLDPESLDGSLDNLYRVNCLL